MVDNKRIEREYIERKALIAECDRVHRGEAGGARKLMVDAPAAERRMSMAKCTGMRCPMQYGYKVEECNQTDCPYRTEPITNADRIRAMSDEQLATHLHYIGWDCHLCAECKRLENEPLLRGEDCDEKCVEHCLEWLKQPAEEE